MPDIMVDSSDRPSVILHSPSQPELGPCPVEPAQPAMPAITLSNWDGGSPVLSPAVADSIMMSGNALRIPRTRLPDMA
jgi:hypothetical protein